ncbi:MAG: carbon storage regulator CsrA [Anaerolineales bacterium]|jgi:carbon storage regulator|nr:carbon storage regulator CsrA [Anaerolineales bacterium]
MLVLSRQVDESIIVNDNIIITVLAIEGDRIKIGIDAPRDIPILRRELWQAINEQEKVASDLASRDDTKALETLRDYLLSESSE